MQVTPGYTFTSGEMVTEAKLNLLGQPTVELEAGDVGMEVLDVAEVRTALGNGASGVNYLDNPNLAENRWARGATPTSCPAGARTLRADAWWVRPMGAAVTYERVLSGPNYKSLHSAKVTGAASVTTVEFGQDIERRIATALAGPLVLTFFVYNNTGAALTPTVLVHTADAADNFSATTLRITQAMSSAVANGEWKQYQVALDCTGLTNLANGMQVILRTPSGAMSSTGKSVQFAQLKLELASGVANATEFVVQREASEPSAGAGTVNNLLPNGQVERFGSPAAAVSCADGADAYNAETIFVSPAGGAVTAERSTDAPTNALTATSLKVAGASGVNAVKVGQNLSPADAAKVRREVTWSAWVRYVDGVASATVTPQLVLATPGAESEWQSAAAQVTATLDPCAHDTWTRLSYSFDGSLLADIENGLRWYLLWPSGALDAASKYVEVAQLLLEAGVTARDFEPYRDDPADSAIAGAGSGLTIAGGNTAATVTASELVLRHVDGRPLTVYNVGAAAVIASSGAGGLDTGSPSAGWYGIWVIGNGSAVAAMYSASTTAPALPAGYDYRALVGMQYYSGSALVKFQQVGRKVWQIKQAVHSSTVPTTYTSLALTNYVPPNAKSVFGQAGSTAAGSATRLALSATGIADYEVVLTLADFGGVSAFGNFYSVGSFELPLPTAQTIWQKSALNTVNYRVEVHGYTL